MFNVFYCFDTKGTGHFNFDSLFLVLSKLYIFIKGFIKFFRMQFFAVGCTFS